jgi:hypothetical protein
MFLFKPFDLRLQLFMDTSFGFNLPALNVICIGVF